jgi:hypothetical protein
MHLSCDLDTVRRSLSDVVARNNTIMLTIISIIRPEMHVSCDLDTVRQSLSLKSEIHIIK